MTKLNELLMKNRESFEERFKQMQDNETETISFQDYFSFLQDCFYLDTIYIFENKNDEHDFFSSVNSYKRLEKLTHKYFVEHREIGIKYTQILIEYVRF